MAMLLALLPCSACMSPMNTCVGCERFFQWLNVAVVHQGRTKGFKNSETVLDLTPKSGWDVASAVEAFYNNERDNAHRILAETNCGADVAEFQYTGIKPFFVPAAVFTIHRDELERLSEEYDRFVLQMEAQKVARRVTRNHLVGGGPKALTAEQLLGPIGRELKVAGRPIIEVVFPKEGEIAG